MYKKEKINHYEADIIDASFDSQDDFAFAPLVGGAVGLGKKIFSKSSWKPDAKWMSEARAIIIKNPSAYLNGGNFHDVRKPYAAQIAREILNEQKSYGSRSYPQSSIGHGGVNVPEYVQPSIPKINNNANVPVSKANVINPNILMFSVLGVALIFLAFKLMK